MADITHLRLLRAGSSDWNEWRQQNPAVLPDLEAADLHDCDLKGANLRGARLAEADLTSANLAGARFAGCDLGGAILDRADLSDADLQYANARAASFRAASLLRSNLCSTNLERADLRGASLQDAELGRTILVDVDLTGANYLETCRFRAPVGIDFRTLIRSSQLPVPFLRGCGIPEPLIESLPVLFPKPIECYSVLIRSSSEDAALAERLEADLIARGVRCWRVKPAAGQQPAAPGLGPRLEDTLRPFETRFLAVLSRHATRARSAWLERELKIWMQNERAHNRKLWFAIRTDEARMGLTDPAMEHELNRRAMDFRRWKERKSYFDAVDRLVSALSS